MSQTVSFDDFTTEELSFLVDNMDKLPRHEQVELQTVIETLEKRNQRKNAQLHFLDFMRAVEPSMLQGPQHRIMGGLLDRIKNGELKRLIINIAPRHSKSTVASYLFPAWFLGNFPHKQIIMASHTADLAVDFGRKVRNLVNSDIYKEVFPDVSLATDSKAAGRWNTNKGGVYFALGSGGAMAGRGADCVYFSCKVLTSNGKIPISKVKVGDLVYGYDHEKQRPCWTTVRAGSTQLKPTLVQFGGLLCTPNHRVYTSGGYTLASDARDIAVLKMWEGLSTEEEEHNKGENAVRQGAEEFLLFDSVLTSNKQEHVVSVWEDKDDRRSGVYSVPFIWKACKFGVHSLWKKFPAPSFGARKEFKTARPHRECVLWKNLLQLPQATTKAIENTIRWFLSNMQNAYTKRHEILQYGLLFAAEGERHRLLWEMEFPKAGSEGEGRRDMCLLREEKSARCSTPHRPQHFKQYNEESNTALRNVPQPISYSGVGVCADDFTALLRGEGFRVVDIQTDTGNFFCEEALVHNCAIIDDLHSEQDVKSGNPAIFDTAYDWYQTSVRQRMQPNGCIVVVMTRWHKRDLTGRLVENMVRSPDGDEWEVVELPAIMPSGMPLWPEYWSLEELLKVKASIDSRYWQAQYMQNPVSDEGALIKREWWREWEDEKPPVCEFILGSLDAAAETNNRADYTSITIWGVFYRPDEATGESAANIILLESIRERMEFPELKEVAYKIYKEWELDAFIVEKKSAGTQLYQEMRAAGVPVSEFTPTRATGDKFTRLNAVADIVRSGLVWYPAGKRWAEELVDEIAGFPSYGSDDRVDTTSMALARFRNGGFIKLPTDRWDDEEKTYRRPRKYY